MFVNPLFKKYARNVYRIVVKIGVDVDYKYKKAVSLILTAKI